MADKPWRATAAMAAAAKRGLRLREQFGRGGTEVGVRRAHQLANREELTPVDVKSMHSYFARHAIDKQGKSHHWDSDTDPSAGFVAWLLWGGDAGKAWTDRKAKELREQKTLPSQSSAQTRLTPSSDAAARAARQSARH